MAGLRSELEASGLIFPEMENSNMEAAKEIAKGSGKLIGKRNSKRMFLLVDGLGYDLMLKAISNSPILRKAFSDARIKKITTIVPSFTPTVITSIDSGLTVAEHGIVGSPLYIKETGETGNVFGLSWAPSRDETIGKTDTYPLFPELNTLLSMSKRRGFVYMQHENIISKSSNSNFLHDINYSKYISMDDLIIQSISLIKSRSKKLIYAYVDYIDHAEHTYTKDSELGLAITIYALEHIAERLVPVLREYGWELVITSDHGQISITQRNITQINAKSSIMENLSAPPWGANRIMFFGVSENKKKKFEEQFAKLYGSRFLLYDSEEAIKSGIFGAKSAKSWIRYRFGTYVAIGKGNNLMYYRFPKRRERDTKLAGYHGGMSKEEMEIPLFIL